MILKVGDVLKIVKFSPFHDNISPDVCDAIFVEKDGKIYSIAGCYGEGTFVRDYDEMLDGVL